MRAPSSSPSVYSVPDSEEESDYAPSPSKSKPTNNKRKRVASKPAAAGKGKPKAKANAKEEIVDIEDVGASVNRPHGEGYHGIEGIVGVQDALLGWFEDAREKRGMPWRKRYDPSLSTEEKGQRAYEVSLLKDDPEDEDAALMTPADMGEVMLQQTQVATVIAYWQKWIARWPTIADLAKADIEEVNAAWRGLGYYRRARSLLAGAKTVMGSAKYKGRLPDDPAVLEKEIDGVGRYTAGAICSMAYGVQTPIVDGNVHRLLTRLLALHAPQTAPSTIKFLWAAADQLVGRLPGDKAGVAGDWNQALMELGSQVCKPVGPDCSACPLQTGCKAYTETSAPPPPPSATSKTCTLCAPIPLTSDADADRIPSVTVFPMRKEKKASRVEEEVVCVIQWRGEGCEDRWLFVKRPEKGLLAGLFEPPTTPVTAGLSAAERLDASRTATFNLFAAGAESVSPEQYVERDVGNIPHVFSHINMTYHIHHLLLNTPGDAPPLLMSDNARPAVWLDAAGVESANVGTGVKKVWAEVYGAWGMFVAGGKKAAPAAKKAKVGKEKEVKPSGEMRDGKLYKKVMMPVVASRKKVAEEVAEV
ncbi:A/G-specific adenine glycosylase [Cryptococcus sp. DSM 104549]